MIEFTHPPSILRFHNKTYIVGGQWLQVPPETTREDIPRYGYWKRPDVVQKRTWEVVSSSNKDITYTITHDPSKDRWSCNCPGNMYRGKDCRHIKEVRSELA
jgi:hypothetical protein